ncbi:MAG: putative PurR-regulated permease PerM [Acidimicrobiales bacterium]|jgi:predicted PurR-regulated permease PerM
MLTNRIIEYVFFFGFMGVVAYIVWEMITPFVSALALAAIIVTICYPLYTRIVSKMPKKNETLGALLTTLLVVIIVIFPLVFLASSLVNEAVSIYQLANTENIGFEDSLQNIESTLQQYAPGMELDATEYIKQATTWLAGNVGAIFAGTASTIFLFFIAMIGSFYLFRDGKEFTKKLVSISPLPDDDDELILRRLARAVRSVATGTVMIALIQGTLTAFGLWTFGFERAILFGVIAAFGALIPGVGTSIVFIPAIIYLAFTGSLLSAAGLAVWGMLAVGLIDNLLGPYLMSRGNSLHPFLILISVLGGISVFGPIGFIVGPVIISLFMVLLELYEIHIAGQPNVE